MRKNIKTIKFVNIDITNKFEIFILMIRTNIRKI